MQNYLFWNLLRIFLWFVRSFLVYLLASSFLRYSMFRSYIAIVWGCF